MTLRYTIWTTLLLLPLLVMGCVPGESGGDGDRGDGGPLIPDGAMPAPDAIELEGYIAARAALTCDWLLACDLPPGGNGPALALLVRAAPDGCQAYFEAEYRRRISADELPPSWDEAIFERCRDDVLRSCEDIDQVPACSGIFVGDLAVGEACREGSNDCDSDGHCDLPIGGRECEAECLARLPVGEPCSFDGECLLGPDLDGHCAQGPDDAEGVCAPLVLEGGAGVGEPCGYLADPDRYRYVGCALGGWCDAEWQSPGECQPVLSPGDACEPDGAACQVGVCRDGVCFAVELSNEPGARCADRDLPRCNPAAGLACDWENDRCVLTSGQLGEACGFLGGVACQRGLYCRGAECRVQVEPGGACDPFDEFDPCRNSRCQEGDTGVGLCVRDGGEDPCGADEAQ